MSKLSKILGTTVICGVVVGAIAYAVHKVKEVDEINPFDALDDEDDYCDEDDFFDDEDDFEDVISEDEFESNFDDEFDDFLDDDNDDDDYDAIVDEVTTADAENGVVKDEYEDTLVDNV